MVAGLKFLSKKGFNPQNLSNQKRVWEREQEQKIEERRIRDRQEQLKREQEEEELAQARGDPLKLGFLYKAPPGLEGHSQEQPALTNKQIKSELMESNEASSSDVTQRRPGDDDAAAAFRRMFATSEVGNDDETDEQKTNPISFGTVLRGSTAEGKDRNQDTRSALEKAVGRKSNSVTLDEQIQRFPALANAPRAKGVAQTSQVNFKPLGTQIRNVRCMACGVWGHSRGDRECESSGWDPFQTTGARAPSLLKLQPAEASAARKRDRDSEPDASETDSSMSSRKKHKKRKLSSKHRKRDRKDSNRHSKSRHKDRGDTIREK